MNPSRRLRENVKSESEAYGYTLSVWGSGALLLQTFDLMALDVLFFVLGGVIGFSMLAALAFRDILSRVSSTPDTDMVIGSMIHILASLGTVFISYLMITGLEGIELSYLALLIGANTTFTYNILLLIESYVSDDLYRLEREKASE
ncbi:hypothetical protein ACK3SF_03320 [Candidatus Nanosalina sp. VS9-1]|uniref:hypothetical protein n=1 Tax=Candidatus Nanosalina sp. VS9-1 TaxID=3388566 RepID=UPI0039E130B9